MRPTALTIGLILLTAIVVTGAQSPVANSPEVEDAAQTLLAAAGSGTRIELHPATGTARLVTLDASTAKRGTADPASEARAFFTANAPLFGLSTREPQLSGEAVTVDRLGFTHVSYVQKHHGVPVFGAVLRAHFDPAGRLTAANGLAVPGLESLNPTPAIPAASAAAGAMRFVTKSLERQPTAPLQILGSTLTVFRDGLARGVAGANHLAWEVEIGDNHSVRELVYVDAHNGQLLDHISGTQEIRRTVHHTSFGNSVWTEGDAFPFTGSGTLSTDDVEEVNTLITTAEDVYEMFLNLSGGSYRSYNGNDSTMHSVQASTALDCPNAQWNGRNTEFCANMASDDIIAHEWGHAYTGATHSLIYQWQPGALNESYSDIIGETVDLINGAGSDTPSSLRNDGQCSAFGGNAPPSLIVDGPAAVAGSYSAGDAAFNPAPPWSASGTLELADDGSDTTSDGCSPLQGFTAGRVALIDRGNCTFRDKVAGAQAAGAVAAIIVNNQGDTVITMGGDMPRLAIPSLFIGSSDGEALKLALADGVTVTLSVGGASDTSLRWLIGEDSFSAIRDMWLPNCFGDPARTDDGNYYCSEDDNGGVHTNSGIPNHAYALIVDGGSYNGQVVNGIGLTRAIHIYWRAMSTYQVPTTGFADHAELIELSCQDLIGATLTDPRTGNPASEKISSSHCAQVAAAMAAVNMSSEPGSCDFQPLLQADAPALGELVPIFSESFDGDPGASWTRSNQGVYGEYDPRDWEWTVDVPEGGDGGAFFAIDSLMIGDCQPGSDDQSGVMFLESPAIVLPSDGRNPLLSFDHYVATEAGWDGGNLKISVNGGDFVPVGSPAFLFNPYNAILQTSNNSNPMRGQLAFTGSNGGSFEGSWGQSQVDLSGFAGPGDTLRLRFDFGVDGCNGNLGWYVDNVTVWMEPGPAPRRSTGRRGN